MSQWIQNNPTDQQQTRRQAFLAMVAAIPTVRGWFGLSARRVTELVGSKLQAKSVTSSIFLGFARGIGDWIQAVLELKQSLYLEPPIPKGNRWVEHLRNTYRDYGLDYASLKWERQSDETVAQYEARLEEYAQTLVDVFRKQSVTKEALLNSLSSILPAGATVTVVEPYTLVKPWPSPRGYRINQYEGETDASFQARLLAYDKLYQANKALPMTDSGGKPTEGVLPNTVYPVPADRVVRDGAFDEQAQGILSKRLSLLKYDLGGYTNLGGTYSRRFPSDRNQGGRLEITLSEDLPGAFTRLNALKAAGVQMTLYVTQGLGVALSTANQNPALIEPLMDAVKTDLVVVDDPRIPVGPFVVDNS